MKFFTLLLVGVSLCGCATPAGMGLELVAGVHSCEPVDRPQDSIVGGQAVSLGDPDANLVTMLTIRRGSHDSVCTGTLISDHVILTAAHCVEGVGMDSVEAEFLTSEGCPIDHRKKILAPVLRIILHKEFDGSPRSLADLALLYLEDKAPREQQRLPLVRDGERPSGDKILFLGFGISGETQKDSQVLRRVHKSYRSDLKYRDRVIVVDQKDRKGFCRGDSGAPILGDIFGEPHILGVNSANIGMQQNNECHTLSLAMDANYFSSWIHSNQRKLEATNWVGRLFSSSVQRQ